jgi:TetR/AcrR family transcriptional repressor of nem operon
VTVRAIRGDETAARVLDIAERFVQVRGFNGFSYADVAAELGVTKAALHYHFASKGDLGAALIDRYCARLAARLAALDAGCPAAVDRLHGYVGLYRGMLAEGRLCLCAMLAAEYHTLPGPMQAAVLRFFGQNEAWLESVLAGAAAEGSITLRGPARDAAVALVAGLEGAMLVARPFGDLARFEIAAASLVRSLTGDVFPGAALAGAAPARTQRP